MIFAIRFAWNIVKFCQKCLCKVYIVSHNSILTLLCIFGYLRMNSATCLFLKSRFGKINAAVLNILHVRNKSIAVSLVQCGNAYPQYLCSLFPANHFVHIGPPLRVKHFNYTYLRNAFRTALLNEMESKIGPSFKKVKAKCYREHKQGFYVYAKPNLCDPKIVVKYIGRYLGRPVIATSRIDKYDGEMVTFH